MKTIENITKETTRILSLFVAFIFLFSLAAEAQKSMKSVEFNKISYRINTGKENLLIIIRPSSLNKEILDNDMEFENWMADLNEWAGKADSGSYEVPATEESFDQELEFENWMFKKDLTKEKNTPMQEPQKLESWMYTPADWALASR